MHEKKIGKEEYKLECCVKASHSTEGEGRGDQDCRGKKLLRSRESWKNLGPRAQSDVGRPVEKGEMSCYSYENGREELCSLESQNWGKGGRGIVRIILFRRLG